MISKCSLKMSGKVRGKSGNLIMTGEWQPCKVDPHFSKSTVCLDDMNLGVIFHVLHVMEKFEDQVLC